MAVSIELYHPGTYSRHRVLVVRWLADGTPIVLWGHDEHEVRGGRLRGVPDWELTEESRKLLEGAKP